MAEVPCVSVSALPDSYVNTRRKTGEKSCDGTLTITKSAEAPDFPLDSFKNITSGKVKSTNLQRAHTLFGTAASDSVEVQNHQLSSANVDLFWAAGLPGFTLGLVAVISHISRP